jgi:hypothetical protein
MSVNLSVENIDEVVEGIVTAVTVNPIVGGIDIIKGVAAIFGWEQETTTPETVKTQLPAAAASATAEQKQQLITLFLQVQDDQAKAQTAEANLGESILNQG